mmetsp:Transcript_82486/g.256501  ORF Transcript_82486/g.256501 Transcript_82486/m.256501 type:complete len:551 (-) Transcript_82486:151-1803(-)
MPAPAPGAMAEQGGGVGSPPWTPHRLVPEAERWRRTQETHNRLRRAAEALEASRDAERRKRGELEISAASEVDSWKRTARQMEIERDTAERVARTTAEEALQKVHSSSWAHTQQAAEYEDRIRALEALLAEERRAHGEELQRHADLVRQAQEDADARVQEVRQQCDAAVAAAARRAEEAEGEAEEEALAEEEAEGEQEEAESDNESEADSEAKAASEEGAEEAKAESQEPGSEDSPWEADWDPNRAAAQGEAAEAEQPEEAEEAKAAEPEEPEDPEAPKIEGPPRKGGVLTGPSTLREKELMKLKKKIREIESLEQKEAAGETLAANQRAKMDKKDSLTKELKDWEEAVEDYTVVVKGEIKEVLNPLYGAKLAVLGHDKHLLLHAAFLNPPVPLKDFTKLRDKLKEGRTLQVRVLRDYAQVSELPLEEEETRAVEIERLLGEYDAVRQEDERRYEELKALGTWSTEFYDGKVSSVKNFGVFVWIWGCREILVRSDAMLQKYLAWDPDKGEQSPDRYAISVGTEVKVRLKWLAATHKYEAKITGSMLEYDA